MVVELSVFGLVLIIALNLLRSWHLDLVQLRNERLAIQEQQANIRVVKDKVKAIETTLLDKYKPKEGE